MSLEDLKNKIKEDIPISSIIGSYLAVKKQGSTMISLCPFHSDTKPSMHINDSKKMFKCFACDAAGDSISFVMKHRHLEFIDALKEICQKQGLHFESYQDEKKSHPKMEMGKKILSKTAQLYRKMATTHKFFAYDDFIKKRGLDEEIANTYTLGFATSKNSLLDYLSSIADEKERSFALDIALELGLIKKDKDNPKNHYDTFRDRIIFPIWDHFGQVIGFTSRAIRDDQKAKYMNSPESFMFKKQNILYGLHLAKNAIREQDAVILVEGNMDQIALFHYGFKNTVAVMGIALGAQSLERLVHLTKNIFLALDTDGAGFSAMTRINAQLAEKGIVAKYLEFSPAKDPDEYLKTEGALAFQKKMDNALPAFDILLNKLIPEKIPEVLDRKLEILHQAFELVSPLQLNMAGTERVVTFARRLGLKAEPAQIINNYSEYFKAPREEKILPALLKETEEITIANEIPEFIENTNRLSKIEKILVQELVQLPSVLSSVNLSELLDLVTSLEVKKYIEKVSRLTLEIDESEYVAVVSRLTDSDDYSSDLKEAARGALFLYRSAELDKKNKARLVHDLKIKLQTEVLRIRKEELNLLQKKCNDDIEMQEILTQLTEIEKKIQILKKSKPEKK
jgi:DNA primase